MRTKGIVLGFALIFLLPGAIVAQDVEKNKAKEHFERGVKFFKEGKFQDALMDFESSYKFRPHWMLLFNIASCHYELGHYLKAAETVSAFLKAAKGKVSGEQMKLALELLSSAKKKLAVLKLTWQKDIPALILDGKLKEGLASGQEIFLLPGSHSVKVTAGGRIIVDEDLVLEEGTERDLDIASLMGKAPVEEAGPAIPGNVSVEEAGQMEGAGAGTPAADKKIVMKRAAWATLTLGVVSLAAGAITAGLSWNQKELMLDSKRDFFEAYDDAGVSTAELAAMRESVLDHREKGRKLFVASAVLLAAGGAFAVAGAAIGLFSLRGRKEKEAGRFSLIFPWGSMLLRFGF
jgi:hypothetical protein